jgi:hypothetical protein
MEERLTGLIDRLADHRERGSFPPNAGASCRFCDFRPLCPMWPEGRELFAPTDRRSVAPADNRREEPAMAAARGSDEAAP